MFYILVNSICTTWRSFAFLALLLQVATGWKGTQPSRWPKLTKERSLPNNTLPSKEGISGNLTYFSHELVGHWSFHRRLWVTAFASLVFFSLLTKEIFGDCFIFTQVFLLFFSQPTGGLWGPWARSFMELSCQSGLSHIPIAHFHSSAGVHNMHLKNSSCVSYPGSRASPAPHSVLLPLDKETWKSIKPCLSKASNNLETNVNIHEWLHWF